MSGIEVGPAFGYALIVVGSVWLVFSLSALAWLALRRPAPARPLPQRRPYRPLAETQRIDRWRG